MRRATSGAALKMVCRGRRRSLFFMGQLWISWDICEVFANNLFCALDKLHVNGFIIIMTDFYLTKGTIEPVPTTLRNRL